MNIPKMIHKCGKALGFDAYWATAEVSAKEGEYVVCLLCQLIDVQL
jgi:hypothetical protein